MILSRSLSLYIHACKTGWWFQPLWKTLVTMHNYSQYIEKQLFQTTNQYLYIYIQTYNIYICVHIYIHICVHLYIYIYMIYHSWIYLIKSPALRGPVLGTETPTQHPVDHWNLAISTWCHRSHRELQPLWSHFLG